MGEDLRRGTAFLERRQLNLYAVNSVNAIDKEDQDEDEGDLRKGQARAKQREGL